MQRGLNPIHNDEHEHTQHARLRTAMSDRSELTCEHIQNLLTSFIEAEQMRVIDVDTEPYYVAFLHHLDNCAACIELYTGIVDDLEALAGETGTLPQTKPMPPLFFNVTRQSEQVCLRLFHGLARRFELMLSIPPLRPSIAVLSNQTNFILFSDLLPEVRNTPFISVSLGTVDETLGTLQVAVREAAVQTYWRIYITAGEMMLVADTDGRGIARFEELPLNNIQKITLSCTELVVES